MRNRQRGIFTIFELILLGAMVLAILGAIYGLFVFVDDHWETKAGITRGTTDTTALYAKRDNKALNDAIAAKAVADARIVELEGKLTGTIVLADTNYQKGLQDGKAEVDAKVAAVHAGYRLRDADGTASCPAAGPQDQGGSTGAAASGRNAQAGGELRTTTGCSLSESKSAALYVLAGDADDNTKQLAACQVTAQGYYDFIVNGGAGASP